MQEKRLWLLFILFSFSGSAQIKGVVVDENNKPIPYVNIWVENENSGTTTEEDGTFTINTAEKGQHLILSSLGYETKKTTISDAKIIVLKSKVVTLDEMLISKPKNTKLIEIGDSKKRFYLPEPQVVPWFFARKFQLDDNKEELKYVKEIFFFTKSDVDKGIFRARVYEVKNDSMPGEDLITDEIIVATKKGEHKTIVDISKYKLQIPKQGIVVAFESLLVNQNEYYQEVVSLKPKKKFKILNYAPHIMYFYNDLIETYNFRSGKWIHFTKEYNEKHKEIKVPIPAINLVLTN
jgi:CarboxypepD_reg-like domain